MSFVLNPVNEQQLSLFDSYENLTEGKRNSSINPGQNILQSIFSQRLMKSLMLSFTVEKIPGQILR